MTKPTAITGALADEYARLNNIQNAMQLNLNTQILPASYAEQHLAHQYMDFAMSALSDSVSDNHKADTMKMFESAKKTNHSPQHLFKVVEQWCVNMQPAEKADDVLIKSFARQKLMDHPLANTMEQDAIDQILEYKTLDSESTYAFILDLQLAPKTSFKSSDCEVLQDMEIFKKAKNSLADSKKLDRVYKNATMRTTDSSRLPTVVVDAVASVFKKKMIDDGIEIQLIPSTQSKLINQQHSQDNITPSADFYYKTDSEISFVQISTIGMDSTSGPKVSDYKAPTTSMLMNAKILKDMAPDAKISAHVLTFGMIGLNDYIELAKSAEVTGDENIKNYIVNTLTNAFENDSNTMFITDSKVHNSKFNQLLEANKSSIKSALDAVTHMNREYVAHDIAPSLLLPPEKVELSEQQNELANKLLANYAYNQALLKELKTISGEVEKKITNIKPLNEGKITGKTCKSVTRSYNPKPEDVIEFFKENGVDITEQDITYNSNTSKMVVDSKKLQADIKAAGIEIDELKNNTRSLRLNTRSKEYKDVYGPIIENLVAKSIADVENIHVEALAYIENDFDPEVKMKLDATSDTSSLGYDDEPVIEETQTPGVSP